MEIGWRRLGQVVNRPGHLSLAGSAVRTEIPRTMGDRSAQRTLRGTDDPRWVPVVSKTIPRRGGRRDPVGRPSERPPDRGIEDDTTATRPESSDHGFIPADHPTPSLAADFVRPEAPEGL